jgi:hypothetical protein
MRKRQMKIPPEIREKLFRRAMEVADHIKVDQLDCSVSIHREATDKTPEEVLQFVLAEKRPHCVMIEREMGFVGQKDYWDVGASTFDTSPTYFLWIKLSIPVGEALIKEFELQEKPL